MSDQNLGQASTRQPFQQGGNSFDLFRRFPAELRSEPQSPEELFDAVDGLPKDVIQRTGHRRGQLRGPTQERLRLGIVVALFRRKTEAQ